MVDVILGLQWGDEGKGKIVDFFTPRYQVIARFQGGPNAGHSIVVNGIKHVLHNIPSGVYHPGTLNVIGNGVVLDPESFAREVNDVQQSGFELRDRLFISDRSHIILPSHRLVDEALELRKGDNRIGSTRKGIGPVYTDKIARHGLRVGDLFQPGFEKRYKSLVVMHQEIYEPLGLQLDAGAEASWFQALDFLRTFPVINSEYFLNECLADGKKVLAEGAQGSMLDVDFGSYPFVTSSSTTCGGVCTGLGISPRKIDRVFGVFKAYCTRVGSGPFPTELFDNTGKTLAEKGKEVGATTGRPRRCGWLDMVALRYACMVNGVTDLIMTKPDVLGGFPVFNVGVAYTMAQGRSITLPVDLSQIQSVVYEEFDGWQEDISSMAHENEFPEELNSYIDYIEAETDIPIGIVSVGPDRNQTVIRGLDE